MRKKKIHKEEKRKGGIAQLKTVEIKKYISNYKNVSGLNVSSEVKD